MAQYLIYVKKEFWEETKDNSSSTILVNADEMAQFKKDEEFYFSNKTLNFYNGKGENETKELVFSVRIDAVIAVQKIC